MTLLDTRPKLMASGEQRLLVMHAKASPDLGEGFVEAVTSVFDVEFTEGGFKPRQVIIERGAFAESLAEKPTAAIMWQHEWGHGPIGQTLEEQETETGLHILGEMFIDEDPLAKRVYRAMKPREEGGRGTLTEWSIGFYPKQTRKEERGTEEEPEEPLYHYEVIDRAEHSIVLRGANPLTETISINASGVAVNHDGRPVDPCTTPSEFVVAGRRYVAEDGVEIVDGSHLPSRIVIAGTAYVETEFGEVLPVEVDEITPSFLPGAERLLRRRAVRALLNRGA